MGGGTNVINAGTSTEARLTGKVKWFDAGKGCGFIRPDDGGQDLFVHYNFIKGERDEWKTLVEGEEVEYDLVETSKGPQAHNVVGHKAG